MTANLRYLNASFFSFCFHALIFLYIYGTFDTNNSQSLLISKPLMVQLRFESEIQAAQKKIRPVNKPPDTQSFQQQERKTNSSESTESVIPVIEEPMLYSNLADLLEQEESVILSEQDEKIFFYNKLMLIIMVNLMEVLKVTLFFEKIGKFKKKEENSFELINCLIRC
jgi:hypothetical protein